MFYNMFLKIRNIQIMNVPESFVDLIYSADNHQNYIGMGNPNAKILIIGREPAHDLQTEERKENHRQDIELNRENWKNLIEGKPLIGRCNPRRPFPNQRCFKQDKSGQGTAMTWVNYQKLVDLILLREYDTPYSIRPVDFHDFCFHTDISAASAMNRQKVDKNSKKASVEERSRELFSHTFFRQFPLVILNLGKDVAPNGYVPLEWCSKVMGFPEATRIWKKPMLWLNKDAEHHRILLHTTNISVNCEAGGGWEFLKVIRQTAYLYGSNPQFYWPNLY